VTNAIVVVLILMGAFAFVATMSYAVAMLSAMGEDFAKTKVGAAENDRNIRRLLREISEYTTDFGVRIERNVKMRARVAELVEDAVKRARAMQEIVAAREAEMRGRGMTPERLGHGWGAYFDGASKGELDRIMLRI